MSKAPRKARSFAAALSPIEETPPAAVSAPIETPAPAPAARSATKPVGVLTLMADDDRMRLKVLAMQERTSVQQLGHEAWNLLLAKRGLGPIVPTTANVPSGQKGD